MAYMAWNKPDLALDDFERVLTLNESWQRHVQQAVMSDVQLCEVLWSKKGAYQALAALMPTLTSTPSPKATPTAVPSNTSILPADTPTQTPTATSIATTTSTPALTPTPTPTSSPTHTPTATPLPLPSPTPYPPPVLVEPVDGIAVADRPPPLFWNWPRELTQDEYFEVRIWHEGEPYHTGIVWVKRSPFDFNLKGFPTGKYFWSIAVMCGRVRSKGWPGMDAWEGIDLVTQLSEESEIRSFFLTANDDFNCDRHFCN
jgi:hypothetical protein